MFLNHKHPAPRCDIPKRNRDCQKNNGRKQEVEDLDCVPKIAHTSSQRASQSVFDDNDAVIKVTIKGQSPTMRHVSQTHRVDLDWLLERIHLEIPAHKSLTFQPRVHILGNDGRSSHTCLIS